MRERAMDKYDMFIISSAPHSKKSKNIGDAYLKEVKRHDNKLKPQIKPLDYDGVKNLLYGLGLKKKWDNYKK